MYFTESSRTKNVARLNRELGVQLEAFLKKYPEKGRKPYKRKTRGRWLVDLPDGERIELWFVTRFIHMVYPDHVVRWSVGHPNRGALSELTLHHEEASKLIPSLILLTFGMIKFHALPLEVKESVRSDHLEKQMTADLESGNFKVPMPYYLWTEKAASDQQYYVSGEHRKVNKRINICKLYTEGSPR